MTATRARRGNIKLLTALTFLVGGGVAVGIQAAQWVQDDGALQVEYSTSDPTTLPPAAAGGSAAAVAAEAAAGDQTALPADDAVAPPAPTKRTNLTPVPRVSKVTATAGVKPARSAAVDEVATPVPQRELGDAAAGSRPNAVNSRSLADSMDAGEYAADTADAESMGGVPDDTASRAADAAASVGTAEAAMSTGPRDPVAYVPAGPQYLVQPGDILQITVWKEEDLQREVLVRPDGGMSFPLAGDVVAAGRTVEQIQKDLSARIESFIPEPVVTVAVKQVVGNRVYVVGRVNKPGEIIMGHELTVMQALSLAGGVTPFAALNRVHVLRRDSGVERSIPFRYGDVEKGRNLSQNIVLQNGDVVVVP
jgi:polysaccharide export outer membrane protein